MMHLHRFSLCVVVLCSVYAVADELGGLTTGSVPSRDVALQVPDWSGTTVRDLWGEYSNIFRYGNRNAASHLWSAFLMERAPKMSRARFVELSGGYCAVSGSPVTPMDQTRYKMTLDNVRGGRETGFTYYCCWPCVCDTQDFIKVDTKTVRTVEGPKQYRFLVIGNPCLAPSQIPHEAPEVRCKGDRLLGAEMSDNGHVIIAMFFDFEGNGKAFNNEVEFKPHCEDRARNGYNSGMGEIFRHVAGISPIQVPEARPPAEISHAPQQIEGVTPAEAAELQQGRVSVAETVPAEAVQEDEPAQGQEARAHDVHGDP